MLADRVVAPLVPTGLEGRGAGGSRCRVETVSVLLTVPFAGGVTEAGL